MGPSRPVYHADIVDHSASQSERITLIKIALLNKVGEGGMKHYGYDGPPGPPKSTPAPAHTSTNTSARQQSSVQPAPTTSSPSQDEGMYL